ncbi:hypothetical protein KAFR_0C02350 [Kazachstania africana CBS 2517]|uniref:DASH complex subunit DAM1 n=1 Tax=Kazachstania africana (strain ATCC 22294 / BCRC 22015 / CBS 2517 / CECT 1963 / NBRC 1671 / NRRL Y-8276) TaxID=1071382 RepID=H2AS78_KAZAF|nr:hypothetical protein KAFR_0C02350 [Kazachstania africana CBS 2517]CCF57228.1 hypothetical protein KAFR_0C02350 [Kazachstania africana CBS 2517]
MDEEKSRTGTEYRLSVSSNPGSRRSSFGSNNDGTSYNDDMTAAVNETEQNVLQEYLVPQIRELSDSMITLDDNFIRLNEIHNSLVNLNESFGSLIYGMMCISACIDFPGIPYNVEKELRSMKRLQALKIERESLTKELEELKKPNKQAVNDSKFVVPHFPPTQLNKRLEKNGPRSVSENRNRHFAQPKSNKDQTGGDDDDTNSEASFVMNPLVKPPPNYRDSNHEIRNEDKRDNTSRLRRKSILHTIRNSLSAEHTSSTNIFSTEERREKPTSSATRIPSPKKRKNPLFQANSRNIASANMNRVNKRKTERKPVPMDKRPPFR